MTSHPAAPQQGIRQRIRHVVVTAILFEVLFAYFVVVALRYIYSAPAEETPTVAYVMFLAALYGGVMTIVDAKHRIRA